MTPLRELTRLNLLRFRRMLGLMAFYYAVMHFSVWLVLDRQLDWPRILAGPGQAALYRARVHGAPDADPAGGDLLGRRGAAARGAAWRKLHRLAYPATALAAIHFVWLVKAWPLEPLLYAAGVAGAARLAGAARTAPAGAGARDGRLSAGEGAQKIRHAGAFFACTTPPGLLSSPAPAARASFAVGKIEGSGSLLRSKYGAMGCRRLSGSLKCRDDEGICGRFGP